MSEIPKPEHQAAPEATPDTLHDAALIAWQSNLDAVRDDALPYGGQSLRLYPTESPRDSILIFPMMGHKSMEDGMFRMIRRNGSKTTDLLDIMTTESGKRLVSSMRGSNLPGVSELVPAHQTAVSKMQRAIGEASTVRPVGKLAKALGRTSIR